MTAANLFALPTGLLVTLGAVAAAEVVLDVIAIVDLVRRPVERVTLGNKWVWAALIVFINLIGAILYFAIGRKGAPPAENVAPTSISRGDAAPVADALYGRREDSGAE